MSVTKKERRDQGMSMVAEMMGSAVSDVSYFRCLWVTQEEWLPSS